MFHNALNLNLILRKENTKNMVMKSSPETNNPTNYLSSLTFYVLTNKV